MKSILLLHGWNYVNYTKLTKSHDAWDNRSDFVSLLEKKYNVYKLNFPGFCGEKEPKKGWTLDDYAKYVNNYIKKNKLKIDYILGYSFGGAVAIKYASVYNPDIKLILVSPAICRNFKKSKKFIKTPKVLSPIRNVIRNIYLKYIIKNPYMKNGTKFLNKSYQNIVRVELINEINSLNANNITIIYGNEDNMVNPKYVYSKLNDKLKKRLYFIKRGGHDIANTHLNELVNIINDVIGGKNE